MVNIDTPLVMVAVGFMQREKPRLLSPQHHGKIRKTNFLKKNEKVKQSHTCDNV